MEQEETGSPAQPDKKECDPAGKRHGGQNGKFRKMEQGFQGEKKMGKWRRSKIQIEN